LETDDDPTALVFTSPNGNPLRHSNFYSRVWRPAVLEADVPIGLRIHDLRHTAAAFMISEGADLLLVGRQLGHSSVTVTQRYAHLYPGAGEDLAARLDSRYQRAQEESVGFAWG
jgi:integrase